MQINAAQQPAAFALAKALQQPQMLVNMLRQSVSGGSTLASTPTPLPSPPANATKGTMLDIII